MTPEQYVHARTVASGSSFYYAFLFLAPQQRQAINAFYAFCREVDDVVDDVHESSIAAAKLAWWRTEVRAAFSGRPTHPIMAALMPSVEQFGITAEHLTAIIDGCQMDLDQNRFLDFGNLQRYCHLVAGVVGEVSARIFGFAEPRTLAYAHQLGLALQLINIIRDVGDDARRGRIYLPLDELKQFGVKPAELLDRRAPWGYSERFTALMQFQSTRARALHRQAFDALPEADRARQRPGLMMGNIYLALLEEIERDGFQVLHQRIALTPLRKLWIALKTQWLGR